MHVCSKMQCNSLFPAGHCVFLSFHSDPYHIFFYQGASDVHEDIVLRFAHAGFNNGFNDIRDYRFYLYYNMTITIMRHLLNTVSKQTLHFRTMLSCTSPGPDLTTRENILSHTIVILHYGQNSLSMSIVSYQNNDNHTIIYWSQI